MMTTIVLRRTDVLTVDGLAWQWNCIVRNYMAEECIIWRDMFIEMCELTLKIDDKSRVYPSLIRGRTKAEDVGFLRYFCINGATLQSNKRNTKSATATPSRD